MKKFVIATTTLLSGAILAGSALAGGLENYPAAPEAPAEPESATGLTVGVGGFIDFQSGFTSQEQDTNERSVKFQNDTELHFNIDGKAKNGLGYGAVVEIDADVSGDADSEHGSSNDILGADGIADKTYIYLQDKRAGRVELGAVDGPANRLKVDASSISHGTGGIDGDWYDFADTSGGTYILGPDLPITNEAGVSEDAAKVSYYTNRMGGLQAGISYTPDTGNVGTAAGFTADNDAGEFENVITGGLNYQRDFGGMDTELSLTGEIGGSETAALEDLAAWAAGAKVGSRGFSVAGSYGDHGESGQATNSNTDANYWTAGAAYEKDAFGVSVNYIDSEVGNDEHNNIVVGADYQLAPGLVPYVEASFFDLDTTGTVNDNDGSVVLVGTQLNF